MSYRSVLLLGTFAVTSCASFPLGNLQFGGDPVEFLALAPDAPEQWRASGVSGDVQPTDWTEQFNDEVLPTLIIEALENNPNLEVQAALMRSSAAFIDVARAARKPSISATASAGGSSNSVELFDGGNDRFTDAIFSYGLNGSWELDLWNRLSNDIAEADAEFRASAADLAAAELSIAAQTAIAWIQLNSARAQEDVARKTLEARQRTQNLTERRFARGLTRALDVRTARSAVAGAEAAIAGQMQASEEAARRLEVLLGRYPAAEIKALEALPNLEDISIGGNPTLLLARRPDIASLEAQIESAGLAAEQARLAMYPTLNFTAALSGNDNDLFDAINPQQIAAQALANLAQPLFTGGRLRAQQEAAIALAEAAVASYAVGALAAWQEVENAIAADHYLSIQVDAQRRSLEEARYAEELTERSYTSGTATIFNLIDAQTNRLNAESLVVSARSNRAINRVNYHLALGGSVPANVAQTVNPTVSTQAEGTSTLNAG